MTKYNGLNRNKPPRMARPETHARNMQWRQYVWDRGQYLIDKYGYLICEYSGERINELSLSGYPDDGWGHHADGDRNNCTPKNCYIVKYKYHRFIEEHHIQVKQEDFQGRVKSE